MVKKNPKLAMEFLLLISKNFCWTGEKRLKIALKNYFKDHIIINFGFELYNYSWTQHKFSCMFTDSNDPLMKRVHYEKEGRDIESATVWFL